MTMSGRTSARVGFLIVLGALSLLALLAAGNASAKDVTVWINTTGTPVHNGSYPLDVTVDNDPNGATGGVVEVQLYIDGAPSGAPLDFGQMNSGVRDTQRVNRTLLCGSHTIGAWVDPTDVVSENNETNNNFTMNVVVQPLLNFSSVLNGALGTYTLNLTANATGCLPLNYTWLVDGIAKNGSTVEYTPLAGNWTVNLTATKSTDPLINRTISRVVSIPNKGPVATVTLADSTITTGQALGIQVQASDDDGIISSYLFDFGNGNNTTSLTAAFDYEYTRPGNYTVTVTVRDNLNGSTVFTANVTVSNRPPEARTAAFLAGNAGATISFNGSASSDPDGGPVTITWNFGDGSNASSAVAQHSYANPGTYTATMTVTDQDGGTATASVQVQVAGAADSGIGGWMILGLLLLLALIAALYLITRRRKDDKEADKLKVPEDTKDAGKPPSP